MVGPVTATTAVLVGQARTPVDVFQSIYTVFLGLGTLVGIVVLSYTLYNGYKYRYRGGPDVEAEPPSGVRRPELGELPRGSGGGRKLFVSFGISAIIVLSLIVWTYSALLYVEDTPDPDVEIDVTGQRFSWTFTYPNGHSTNELRLPRGETVRLRVTAADVMHNLGIPAFRVKTDAIPGTTNSVWFTPERTGTFDAVCYELCGAGHSNMRARVTVVQPEAYRDWYADTGSNATTAALAGGGT